MMTKNILLLILASSLSNGCNNDDGTNEPIDLDVTINLISLNQSTAKIQIIANKESRGYFAIQDAKEPILSSQEFKNEFENDALNNLYQEELIFEDELTSTLNASNLLKFESHRIYVLILDKAGVEVFKTIDLLNPLEEIHQQLKALPDIFSFVASENGEIFFERYYNDHSEDDLENGRSLAKGITSIVIGKAIELGYLELSSKLENYFPDQYLVNLEEEKRNITVEQFLTMSSGLGGLESEFSTWIQSEDEIQFVLDRELITEPGNAFSYSTPNLQMLSVMFQEATGKTLLEFGNEHVFKPIGISMIEWPSFDSGYTLAGSAIFLTTRDYLKIGELLLNEGKFNGENIINSEYLNSMHRKHFSTGFPSPIFADLKMEWFGYLWWGLDKGNLLGYSSQGYGGQFIVVYPSENLVIAINSRTQGVFNTAGEHNNKVMGIISDFVDAIK